MRTVTDRVRDPFELNPPCGAPCPGAPAVLAYGDANADVHVVGDHPGRHGGAESGVPFGGAAGRPVRSVLAAVGLLAGSPPGATAPAEGGVGGRPDGGPTTDDGPATDGDATADDGPATDGGPTAGDDARPDPAAPDGVGPGAAVSGDADGADDGDGWLAAPGGPAVRNCFLSYLHPCCPADGGPTEADYARLEPGFDAELRAVAADVIVAVGDRPVRHVLRSYTPRRPVAAAEVHGRELHGSGFLVVALADPATWSDRDRDRAVAGLARTLDTDYRQRADLGRFTPGADEYVVR